MFSLDLESRIIALAEAGAPVDSLGKPLGQDDSTSLWGSGIDALLQGGSLTDHQLDELAWGVVQAWNGPRVEYPTNLLGGPGILSRPFLQRFKLGILLGQGATAWVHRAFDERLQRPVAIKILKQEGPGTTGVVLGEARAQARIDHPHVCKVFEVTGEEGGGVLVLQLAEGGTLAEAQSGLPHIEIVRLIMEAAEGVHAAHLQGFLHLDLKPANILLRESHAPHHALVSDFGMFRGIDCAGPAFPRGTPPFSSPEQLSPKVQGLDARSDVFSLGASLFVLLSGQSPYQANGFRHLLSLIREGLISLGSLREMGIHRDLVAIIGKAMSLDPRDRYQDARTFAEDCRRWLGGQSVVARPIGLVERVSRWMAGHSIHSVMISLGLFLAAAGGGWLGYQLHQRKAEAAFSLKIEREVERWERYYHAAIRQPPHDLQVEVSQVLKVVQSLQAQMEEEGAPAQRPGLRAVGRLLRMIGREKDATDAFLRAWSLGDPSPSVKLQLALSKIQAFAGDLGATLEAPPRAGLQAGLETLAETHLVPARGLLLEARTSLDPPDQALVQVLVAVVDLNFERALDELDLVRREHPNSWEAARLEAQIRLMQIQADLLRRRHETDGANQRHDQVDHRRALEQFLMKVESEMPSEPEWKGIRDALAKLR